MIFHKSTKCIGDLFGRGRKRKTTSTTDRIIQRKLKVDRRKSASVVNRDIENELGIVLHADAIQKRAHEVRLFRLVARKKPYVNRINRGKRFGFARGMLEKPLQYWEYDVWSDELNLTFADQMGRPWL